MKQYKKPFIFIAGPCSVESRDQMQLILDLLHKEELSYFRGGVYKLRTSPHSFQGLGEQALVLIQQMKAQYKGFQFVSEITSPRQIHKLYPIVDMFQVGARNMYNYELLKELGAQEKPVLLKRAFSALVKEWLLAAEYIVKGGNSQIILCERGIRTFETSTRNTLDLGGALIAKKESEWPVIVDPSHGVGRDDLVPAMALSAVACGLDGLLVEMHPNPKKALSDAYQALDFVQFRNMVKDIKTLLSVMGRRLEERPIDKIFTSKRFVHEPSYSQS